MAGSVAANVLDSSRERVDHCDRHLEVEELGSEVDVGSNAHTTADDRPRSLVADQLDAVERFGDTREKFPSHIGVHQ